MLLYFEDLEFLLNFLLILLGFLESLLLYLFLKQEDSFLQVKVFSLSISFLILFFHLLILAH
uniref:Uncharacterized protein n=1 Tax=Physcomitrium patens TaxID=3218 RepID=A0A2K1KVC8_PHYPA|nr:hypothetical protein PHYPA_004715 [Physcomitrium patens]